MTINIVCPHCKGRFQIRTKKDEEEKRKLEAEIQGLKKYNPPFGNIFPWMKS